MAAAGDSQLFEDSFTVTKVDQSKYDRVARLFGTSTDAQTVLTLDINTELFPCAVGETLTVVIATTLALDGGGAGGSGGGGAGAAAGAAGAGAGGAAGASGTTPSASDKGWRDLTKGDGNESTLADLYDYVCYGKIYKFEDGDDGQTIKAYISFGGLLMSLSGPFKKLTPLRVDYTYLLVKK